jgi:predicted  nucleic acid-binding Zn-ribbon protein
MSAALGLYRLQQVDSQMDQIQARLRTIRETLEDDVELRAATNAFFATESDHQQRIDVLRQSEADVEKQTIKIKQTEASLYGGKVHNPKELQDLQSDVASLKKHLGTLEDREIEAMARVEEAEKNLETAKASLNDVHMRVKSQNVDLTNESETLKASLEKLGTERKAVTADLDDQSLKTYEQLRRQKRGIAVSTISESACSACGTTLTASQHQTARSSAAFFYCPTCGRIMYAG